jgi:diguanylate cyclase (GGDEF)-like protein/PAS domain S-box-containing protein
MELGDDERLRRFEALAHASPDFIAIAGIDGRVEWVNAAGRALVGIPDDVDVARTSIADYLTDRGGRASAEVEQPAVLRDGFWQGQATLRDWRTGDDIPVEVTSFLIRDLTTAEPVALATVQRDVRERIAAEQRLAEAQEAVRRNEQWYRSLLLNMSDVVLVSDPAGAVTYASPPAARVLGLPPGQALPSVVDLVHPGDREAVLSALRYVVARPGVHRPMELRLLTADGGSRRFEAISNNLLDDPDVRGVVTVSRDVTERHRAELALQSQAAVLEMIARGDSLRDVLVTLAGAVQQQADDVPCTIQLLEGAAPDQRLRCVLAPGQAQPYAEAVDGMPIGMAGSPCARAAHLGRTVLVDDVVTDPEWLALRPLAERTGCRAWWAFPITSPATGETLGTFALHPTGTGLPAPEVVALMERAIHLVGIAIDRSRMSERLTHQATHDELTGLPNRTLLTDRLEGALARHARDRSTTPVLVFLDLDRLKVVNDSLGHETGDELLVTVARRLRALLRSTDTVARFGGDEFVVLAEEADGHGDPLRLVEKVLAAVAEPVLLAGRVISPSASAGVVVADGGSTASAMIRDADIAMYRAKQHGGSRYELFDADMRDRAMQRLDLEAQLRHGLETEEFRLVYQPVVDLVDGRVRGFEALVRWQHPTRGLLGPAEFIGLAEETGLIVPLGEWVLRAAAQTVAGWPAADRDGLELAVNVSGRQLGSPGLLEAVREAVGVLGPTSLSLELTESTLMGDTASSRGLLDELAASQVRLSIDDFGTGYSSLAYLTRLPVSALKIDRSFVVGLGSERSAATVAAAVLRLAEQLGLGVVAEGVETAQQQEVLLQLGCTRAQGFLFSRPVEAEVARGLLGRTTSS